MTTQPVKYFEHFFAGHRSIAVHRLDELVQITFSHGAGDLEPEVVFLAPTGAAALVEAIDHAAREAKAVLEAAELAAAAHRPPPAQRPEGSAAGLPVWGRAFTFAGLPLTMCPAGDGRVGPGQSAVPETATGRLWHDDCAEAAREGRQSLTEPLTTASAPPGERSAVASSGGAHGAAGADRASAVPGRPAAPTRR